MLCSGLPFSPVSCSQLGGSLDPKPKASFSIDLKGATAWTEFRSSLPWLPLQTVVSASGLSSANKPQSVQKALLETTPAAKLPVLVWFITLQTSSSKEGGPWHARAMCRNLANRWTSSLPLFCFYSSTMDSKQVFFLQFHPIGPPYI